MDRLATFPGPHFIFWPGQKSAVFWLDVEEWRGKLNELASGENFWLLVVHVGSVNILKISGHSLFFFFLPEMKLFPEVPSNSEHRPKQKSPAPNTRPYSQKPSQGTAGAGETSLVLAALQE